MRQLEGLGVIRMALVPSLHIAYRIFDGSSVLALETPVGRHEISDAHGFRILLRAGILCLDIRWEKFARTQRKNPQSRTHTSLPFDPQSKRLGKALAFLISDWVRPDVPFRIYCLALGVLQDRMNTDRRERN